MNLGMQVQLENDNVLTISGERKREDHNPDVKFIRMERSAGNFMRKFTLPANADKEGITAACHDGVLTVTVPKLPPPEPPKPKSIEVTVGWSRIWSTTQRADQQPQSV